MKSFLLIVGLFLLLIPATLYSAATTAKVIMPKKGEFEVDFIRRELSNPDQIRDLFFHINENTLVSRMDSYLWMDIQEEAAVFEELLTMHGVTQEQLTKMYGVMNDYFNLEIDIQQTKQTFEKQNQQASRTELTHEQHSLLNKLYQGLIAQGELIEKAVYPTLKVLYAKLYEQAKLELKDVLDVEHDPDLLPESGPILELDFIARYLEIAQLKDFFDFLWFKGGPLWIDPGLPGILFNHLLARQGIDAKSIEAMRAQVITFSQGQEEFSKKHADFLAKNNITIETATAEEIKKNRDFIKAETAKFDLMEESIMKTINPIVEKLYAKLYLQAAEKMQETPGWDQSSLYKPVGI